MDMYLDVAGVRTASTTPSPPSAPRAIGWDPAGPTSPARMPRQVELALRLTDTDTKPR